MALLWPHYLRPIPSMSILELIPDIDAMQGPLHVPAGAEFASIPVDGTQCRYRSSWPTVLRPLVLADARLETEAARPVRLVLRLRGSSRSKLEDLQLGSLRLHLAGEARVSAILYLLLARHVDFVTISDGSDRHDRPQLQRGPEAIVPAGLGRDEGVLPYPPHSFPGYRLIQEYLSLRERFLFIDLRGLDLAVTQLKLAGVIEVAITFNRRLDSMPLVSRDNFRLHCVPIVNLFSQPAEPIRLRHDRTEYLVQPAASGVSSRRHLEVYSIDRVVGGSSLQGGLASRDYLPFYSFEHMAGGRSGAYYQAHLRPNVLGGDPRFGSDTYISFSPGDPAEDRPAEETLSIELTCTNRHLPGALRANDITQRADTSPPGVQFRNISKPTETACPPMGRALHWRLISHMALNYVSLVDATRFREMLRIYDFQSEYDVQRALQQRRLIEGITQLRSEFAERMVRGAPLRGTQVQMDLNADHFAGMGDAYLFAQVCDRFLGLYATINGFTQLTVRMTQSGDVYTFPPRCGEQMTPADRRQDR